MNINNIKYTMKKIYRNKRVEKITPTELRKDNPEYNLTKELMHSCDKKKKSLIEDESHKKNFYLKII